MYQLTAADFADTGQWRLIIDISRNGLRGVLENTLHPELPPQPLCKASWSKDNRPVKDKIEETVYKNPRLLDDFSTKIIVHDPKTLFFPVSISENNPGEDVEQYCSIVLCEPTDVMIDSDRDVEAVWTLGNGVRSFLNRTFPGSRITNGLLESVRELRNNGKGIQCYVEQREDEADVVITDGRDLITASTHIWNEERDILYLLLNALDVYGFEIGRVDVTYKGIDTDNQISDYLSKKAKIFTRISD